MNRYLDDETRRRIEEKVRRYDDSEMTGKVVAHTTYDGSFVGVSFADGTWCGIYGEAEHDDGVTLHNAHRAFCTIELRDLFDLGLISDGEFAAAREREQAKKNEWKQKEIERLKAEIRRNGK